MRLLRIAAVAAAWLFPMAVVAWLVAASAVLAPATASGTGDFHPGAVESKTASPSPELMRALMAWASPRLGLAMPADVPVIVRKSHCQLQAIAYQTRDCPEHGKGVLALYDSDVLWLRHDWRSDNIRDVSILLHELVHHMQHHAGVAETPCKAEALERPAYEAQFAFLEAAGSILTRPSASTT